MAHPLVSVNMITYNHRPYIAQAIEGALQQRTSFPMEIVIGEDCSTDGTREIVFDYQRRYPALVRVVTSEHNVGAHANSMRVHAACTGKYVAYCEGDDWWQHPLKLQKQVEYLETHPRVGVVHSDHDCYLVKEDVLIRDYTRAYRGMRPNEIDDVFSGLLLGSYRVSTPTACARLELMRQALQQEKALLEDPDTRLSDLIWWLNLCQYCEFHFLEESLATYRVLRESASQHRSKIASFRYLESSERIRMLFAERYACPPAVQRAVKVRYYTTLLSGAYYTRDSALARSARRSLRQMRSGGSLSQQMYFLGATCPASRHLMGPFLRLRRAFLQLRWIRSLHKSRLALR